MTLYELFSKRIPAGAKFRRFSSARIFKLTDAKTSRMLIDDYDRAAVLFEDDVGANDWELIHGDP